MNNKRVRLGRPSSKNWDHFEEGLKRNSAHKTAICNYCAKHILGVSEQMINHLCECKNADDYVDKPFSTHRKKAIYKQIDIMEDLNDDVGIEIQKFITNSRFITLSGDGWTSRTRDSIVNYVIINEKRRSELYKIENKSNQQHLGENVFMDYKEVGMEIGLERWVGFVTDSGGNYAKARRLMNSDPEIKGRVLCLPCMAHQGNLLAKDIIEFAYFKPMIKQMLIIIGHFRIANLAIHKLRQLSDRPTFKMQYPTLTRWATFAASSSQVIIMKDYLKRKNNSAIITIIENSDFWLRLETFHQIMRPYDCMTKLFESDNMTLAQIMTSWAWLAGILEKLPSTLSEIKTFLYDKLKAQWQKIYDPAFIISWILHPLNDSNYLAYGATLDIQEMAYQLFKKLYPNNDSLWAPVFTNNPTKFWQSIEEMHSELSIFAQRLFAIPPNTAVSERIWSVLSNIHTAKRNRLTVKRSDKLAKIFMVFKQEHLKQEQHEKIIKKNSQVIIQERTESEHDKSDLQTSIQINNENEYNFPEDMEVNMQLRKS
ncbi:16261_t:CDS:2 [Funneliformis geosporum]|nr:16261_t:CDS:2 [Funneliformis geosporum]